MARISIPRQIGIVAAATRRSRGLTQQQVAEAADVSRQLINRLEMGTATGIALDKLLAILTATGCVLDVYPLDGADVASVAPSALPNTMPFGPLEDYPFDESLYASNEEVIP